MLGHNCDILSQTLHPLSHSTRIVTPDYCTVCKKSFKRLLHQLNPSLARKSQYMLASDKAAATVPSIVSSIGHVNTGNLLQGATSCKFCPKLSSSLSDELLPALEGGGIVGKADDHELHVKDFNKVDDYIMFDNDSIPEGNADNQDISETESEEGPDLSVLDLYLKLFNLFNCYLCSDELRSIGKRFNVLITIYEVLCTVLVVLVDTYGNLKTLYSP